MKTLLLTGFEPFGGAERNASWEAVRRLDGEEIGGLRVRSRMLPCVFGEALVRLHAEIDDARPAMAIAVGEAGRRAAITPERFAFNCDAARIADNRGNRPRNVPIVPNAAARYETRLPAADMALAIRSAGIPSRVSLSAGRYVCNHVFYGLLHRIETGDSGLRGGFIHVPARMEIETIVAGLRAALGAAAGGTAACR